jgi:4-hydroxy-2-oxoglutarate aldolase
LKYACDILGFNGGYVRKPLLQLKEDDKVKLKAILKDANLI